MVALRDKSALNQQMFELRDKLESQEAAHATREKEMLNRIAELSQQVQQLSSSSQSATSELSSAKAEKVSTDFASFFFLSFAQGDC